MNEESDHEKSAANLGQHSHVSSPPMNREANSSARDPENIIDPELAARTGGSDASSIASSHHDSDDGGDGLSHVSTHVSMGPDSAAEVEHFSSFVEIPDEVYDRFSPARKLVIVAILSYCSFLAPISSTTVLSAVPEVAAEYQTTGTVINLSNALYMLFMGLSPMFWGPLSQVYGRRIVNLTSAVLFFACSIGTALAPNLVAFFIFRILTAFEGTSFILVGSTCISDIYRPTERATAMGWFLSGTLIGPALGPFVGGIIVTFQSWRVIFWLQTGLAGLAAVLAFFLLPETAHHKKVDDLVGYSGTRKARVLWSMINPLRVIRLYYTYPNLMITGLSAAALLFNMYSLLTPIRYVLNPRFGLTTPLQSGLFYLAPGCGYLVGTFMGGRYADYTVRRWMGKRNGQRVPEDRLRSALPFMGVVIPACTLAYGWGVERDVGGVPLAVVALFVQGVAQLFCFPSLNTYCLDVMQSRAPEVIAGNYMIRYLFACLGTAVVLPAIEAIGVGWFSTVSAAYMLAGAAGLAASIAWGKQWRDGIDEGRRRRRAEKGRRRDGKVGGGGEEGVVAS